MVSRRGAAKSFEWSSHPGSTGYTRIRDGELFSYPFQRFQSALLRRRGQPSVLLAAFPVHLSHLANACPESTRVPNRRRTFIPKISRCRYMTTMRIFEGSYSTCFVTDDVKSMASTRRLWRIAGYSALRYCTRIIKHFEERRFAGPSNQWRTMLCSTYMFIHVLYIIRYILILESELLNNTCET